MMEDLKNTKEHKNKIKITYGSMNNEPFYRGHFVSFT